MSDSRDRALRRMLVATVDAGPPSTRPRWQVAALSIAAFAVAGALTAGTFSVVAATQDRDGPAADTVTYRFPDFVEDDVVILGAPLVLTAQSTATLDLGSPPREANALALAGSCVGPSTFAIRFDGQRHSAVTCTETSGGGASVVPLDGWLFEGEAPRDLTVEVMTGGAVIWAAWVYQPPDAEPSAAQQEALADGAVSREEYVAGFDHYVACMAELGFAVSLVGMRDAEVIGYVIPGDAGMSGAANRCYEEHFELVDMEWQVAHAD